VKINDIPQFPKSNWCVDVAWRDLLGWVDQQVRVEGLVIEPDFQRGHVWTTEQRIRYVEYVLRGGEGGKELCFNRPNWNGRGTSADGPYEILDGLQRLTSAMMFMRDELPAFGRRLSEYEDRTALRYYLGFKWRVFELPTRADVLRYYLDMNAGGTPHAESEIARVRALLAKEEA
jgi:hypothetical protein